MNNYITIYVVSQMLAEKLMDYLDEIANNESEIVIRKNNVEFHMGAETNKAEIPPKNMSEFLSKIAGLLNVENIQLPNDILFGINELSWSSALWDNDNIVEVLEFEYDKKEGKSRFTYTKGENKREHTTDESAYAEKLLPKDVNQKEKRAAPKGSAPKLSGEESPAELAEKWFDYWRAKYEAKIDAINEKNRQRFSEIYFNFFGGGEFTEDSEDSFIRIAYSHSGQLNNKLRNGLLSFGLDDDALSALLIEPSEDDYNAIQRAFSESGFEDAVNMLSAFLGFVFSDGKDHPELLEKIKSLFIESAIKCKDINIKYPNVDITNVPHATLEQAGQSFELQDNGATYTITAYIGAEKDIYIPGFIEGKPVYKIDDIAFSSNGNKLRKKQLNAIETVIIPNTVKELGEDVFAGCKKLKKVVFSDAIIKIPDAGRYDGLFAYCSSLIEVILPRYLRYIGTGAFACSALKNVNRPDCLEIICSEAFADCKELENVTFPSSVVEIYDRVFRDCDSMTELVFPPHVKIIREYICSSENLERIVLPAEVEEVEESAFALAKNLKEIVSPARYVKWGAMAIDEDSPFYNKYDYDKNDPSSALMYINYNLIGYKANYSGIDYADVYIKEGTQRLAAFAFSYVRNIEKVHIPSSVIEIDENAFECSDKIIICSKPGGVAEDYANEHDIRFEAE